MWMDSYAKGEIVSIKDSDPLNDLRHICKTVRAHAIIITTLLITISEATPAFSAGYALLRETALKKCEAIDPAQYQTGLFFNPDGYKSYYVRSECFQRTAVEFRDETLCSKVIQRYSLLSSSWGYSPGQCRKLVAEGIAIDRKALEEIKSEYVLSPVRLRDFRIERNGNGRDFDIIPFFMGSYGHGYVLRFEVLQPDIRKEPVVLHSAGYYVNGDSNLRIFLKQEDIRKRFPNFTLNHLYTIQATIILDVGNGSSAGLWSDAFIESIFPAFQRSQMIKRKVLF